MESITARPFRTLAVLLAVLFARPADAQTRYKDIVFPAVTTTSDIPFGSGLNIDGSTATLSLDLYEPQNDTAALRPLVIFIHGGSLISGDKTNMSLFCTDFAQRGYVAVTINYRLGIESPKGVRTILESLLRGVQDTKAAVRFLRSKAADYRIDTSRIFLEGSSAGSMIAVHYAYWNESEIPPDVDQAKWGDIEGTSGTPGYSTAIKGIVNYCGAIVDPAWIDAGDATPVANFHGLLDTVVPPDSGVSTDFEILLYGGVRVSRMAMQQGIYDQASFFPLMGHGGNEDSLRVFSANFFYTLMVLSASVPQDFSSMDLPLSSLRLFRYDDYTFQTTALDPSGNRIILPQSYIQYSCDARVGTIAPFGVFTPSDHADSGFVYAQFGGTTDSCFIRTYDFAYFVMRPHTTVTDTLRTLRLTIDTYDADSLWHDIPMTRFALTSSNPAVGTVDAAGLFTARANGTTTVVGTLHGFSDSCVIHVESATGFVSFESFESLNGWSFSGVSLDTLVATLATNQASAGTASLRLDYSMTYDPAKPTPMIYLSQDRLIYGLPDSIYIDAKTDGRRHRVFYRFTDADSVPFRAYGRKYLSDSVNFSMVNTPMTGLTPLTAVSAPTYPLTLRRIEIQLAGDNVLGKTTTGFLYLDNVRLKYYTPLTGVHVDGAIPGAFRLEQNFPNPFNPSTSIRFTLARRSHVLLTVYSVLGRKIAELINGTQEAGLHEVTFDARGLASGVYFYRLQAGNDVQTRKLLLVR